MNRKPQTFSRVVNGKVTRYYDPRTPDNRNRPKSDFAGLRPYTEMPKVSRWYQLAEFITALLIFATVYFVLVVGGSL